MVLQGDSKGRSIEPSTHLLLQFSLIFEVFVGKRLLEAACFFDMILSRRVRSTAGAHTQSVPACAVETHFSISRLFLKTAPEKISLGFISCENMMRHEQLKNVPAQIHMLMYRPFPKSP